MEQTKPNVWYEPVDYFAIHKHVVSDLIYGDVAGEKPLVSVAIPTFRRSTTLKEAVKSALNQQGFAQYEILVIDNDAEGDQATDVLMKELAGQHRNVVYYRNRQNIGMAGNWNRGIELSRGQWVVLLHDDDLMAPAYLNTVYPVLDRTKCALAGVFSSSLYQLEQNKAQSDEYAAKLTGAQKLFNIFRRGHPFHVKKEDYFRFINPSPLCPALHRETAIKWGGYDCVNPKPGILDGKFHFSLTYHEHSTVIVPVSLAYKRVLENDFLREEAVENILEGVYIWGKYLQAECKWKTLHGFLLDISIVYMALGVKQKYNSSYDINGLLRRMGVRKWLIGLPPTLVHLLKYITLVDLFFRK